MDRLSLRAVLKVWCSAAATLLVSVACGSGDDPIPTNTGGVGGGSGGGTAEMGGHGGGEGAGAPGDAGNGNNNGGNGGNGGGATSRFRARLVAGGVTMSNSKYRLVASMASTSNTSSASKNYELRGGILNRNH